MEVNLAEDVINHVSNRKIGELVELEIERDNETLV